MVSALDYGFGGRDSSLDGDIVLCSWARHFTLTVPLSTKISVLMGSGGHARGNLLMASIPSREGGSRNTPSHFVLQIPGIRRSANTHTEVNQLIK